MFDGDEDSRVLQMQHPGETPSSNWRRIDSCAVADDICWRKPGGVIYIEILSTSQNHHQLFSRRDSCQIVCNNDN